MTLVNIDLRNQGYQTGPDDRVIFYSLLVREGEFGTISTAPVEVRLTDGKATIDLAPGPVGVQIIAGQVADTRVKIGEVPPSGTTTLGAVMMVTPAYTPALQTQFLKAIQAEQAKALDRIDGEVAVAIDAEVGEFKDMSVEALSRAKSAEVTAGVADSKSGAATSTASSAASTANNAVTRVTALEAMSGLSPESPTDGQTANLIAQPTTLTRDALDSAITDGAGILSVKSFGATGDGVTDDTAAIQAALDSVAPERGVTTVTIPDGVYMIQGVNAGDRSQWGSNSAVQNAWVGGGILPRSGTTIDMSPGAVLKIIPNSSPAYSGIFLGLGQDNITIRGGSIIGDRPYHTFAPATGADTHEWGFGIAIRGAQDISIERVTITDCTGDCILVGPQGLMNVSNSTYYPGRRIFITGCTLDGARRNNISGIGCEQVYIENNTISRAGYHDGHSDGVAPRFGIDLEGYGEGEIDYETVEDIVIRGNVFKENVAAAVANFNGYRVVIDGNHSDGPLSFSYGTDTVVSSNVVKNLDRKTSSGIDSTLFPEAWGRSYSARAVVVGNTVTGFSTGISVKRENVLVQGNSVSDFWRAGIGFYASTNSSAIGNQIMNGLGPDTSGITVGLSSDVTIQSNTVRNVRRGVFLDTSSSNILIAGNSITKAREGVYARNGITATIKGNDFDMPGHDDGQANDIWWTSNCSVTCESNLITNSSDISIRGESRVDKVSRIIRNTIVDSSSSMQVYLIGGTPEVVSNTFISKVAAGGSASTPIRLHDSTDRAYISGNVAYHSGDLPIAALVNLGAGTNTRVVGNTVTSNSDSVVSGADGGGLVDLNNTLVAP